MSYEAAKASFVKTGALQVREVIPKDLALFLTHVLMRAPAYTGRKGDQQVQSSLAILDHEPLFETVHERIWHAIEAVIGEELLPTYSYARLYGNQCVLEKHKDRESCEISVTIQLGRTHHYAWPIYMGDQRFDLGEGDGVIYQGCEVEHWREVCDGPDGYMSGQVFCHFVRANGANAEFYQDGRWEGLEAYKKLRHIQLEGK